MVTLHLTPATEQQLQDRVAKGEFPTIQAAIETAIAEFLSQHEHATDPVQLNRMLAEGLDDLRHGRFRDGDDFFKELREESRRRRQANGVRP